ncbi:tRNA (guanosine(46)-N7)-methyltransferase TrmB [Luteolibacter sp. AS25]|uniref:tRNA (guanosine(46)-N7)-methyltransferase TrmB n=1 Tax=Luteolibacter sp. AS25 TaxID=3135776 RepID=UPI00398A7287
MNTLPRPPISDKELVPAHYFQRFDLSEIKKGDRALEFDLGCGDGSFLINLAAHHPDRDFIGVERLLGRCKKVAKRIKRAELDNAKILRLDSKYVVEWMLPAASVSRIHLLCPDPWPKAKHHRRRLVQIPFLQSVKAALEPGGEFLFMTDHEEYFEYACENIHASGLFEILPWEDDSFFYPKTDFQNQWEAEGKSMHRIRCKKSS